MVSFANAITDSSIVPYPAEPPALGPAGSVLIDPFCGNSILRVTDSNTNLAHCGISYTTPSSSEGQPWLADGSGFIIEDLNGTSWRYAFDPAALTTTRVAQVGLADCYCSQQDPSLVWGFGNLKIQQFDVSKGLVRIAIDLTQVAALGIPATPRWYLNSSSVDWWDQRLAANVGPGQDKNWLVVVWDTVLGLAWLNTQTGAYGGWASGQITPWTPFYIHDTRISKSGSLVKIAPSGQSGASGDSMGFWTPGTSQFALVPPGASTPMEGHQALGFQTLFGSYLGVVWNQFLKFPFWAWAGWRNLQNPVPKASTAGVWNDFHISVWPDPEDRNPIMISTENAAGNPTAAGAPLTSRAAWENEIGFFSVDGSGASWRLAHSYASGRTFYSSPRGNVSMDGRFVLFTSDWQGMLGGTYPKQRTDVFCLVTGLVG